jgi:VIT1/CCC1 family predicted Fe2+/Mn2+ transporter
MICYTTNMHIQTAQRRRILREKRRNLHLPLGTERLLALLEGLEGGFAIGASVVVGLSFANLDRRILLISAAIGILVNGFNNATVKYSSEHYADELDGREKHHPLQHYLMPALIEFAAYFAVGFITILPLVLIPQLYVAITFCSMLTLAMLFAAGYWRGFLMRLHPAKDGIEMMFLGACIIVVGGLTGYGLHLL